MTARETLDALRSNRAKRFLFYLVTVTVGPLVFLLLVEGVLRAVARGPETDFFIPFRSNGGETVYTTNDRFAHQYFPPAMARIPRPARIAVPKPQDVYRVLVLGGSAAMGEPEPTFSMGRVLQAMLEQQYPGLTIEVINGALATINSHVAYQIAKEVDRIEPDVVLVYLGNNEVVGPYGAGTVFGAFSPNLAMIRIGIAARKTRVGQLIDHLSSIALGQGQFVTEGQGMAMFQRQRVREDDPRLRRVYDHFRQNLEDLVDEVKRSGAKLVLSTVGSNLADLPPFASALGEGTIDRRGLLYEEGQRLEEVGRPDEAIAIYSKALEIDAGHAGLHYRISRLFRMRGRDVEADKHAIRARDLDTLRFRADSRLNAIIREISAREDVDLVDAVAALHAASNGLPGNDLFYEHVHLTFEGNRVVAKAVVDVLRSTVSGRPTEPVPDAVACADRLALTPWDRYRTLVGMAGLMRRAPFTLQDGHRARRRSMNLRVLALRAMATTGLALQDATDHYERLLESHPADLDIRENYARLLQEVGDLNGAAAAWRVLTDAVPASSWTLGLATVFTDQSAHHAATHLYRDVQRRLPDLTFLNIQIGYDLVAAGRLAEAVAELERGLDRNPGSTIARLNLSGLLMDLGRSAEAYDVLEVGLSKVRADLNVQAEADLLVGKGERLVAEKRFEEAVRAFGGAREAYTSIRDYEGVVTSWVKTAEAYRGSGDRDRAREAYHEARMVCADLAMREEEAGILVGMGLNSMETGDHAEAYRFFGEAKARYADVVIDHPSIEWVERMREAVEISGDEN